jgi:hypothetical protein
MMAVTQLNFRLFKINNPVFGSNNLITLPLLRQKKIRKGTESFPSLFPISAWKHQYR